MYYVAKPIKIQIYINSARKTMAQIKKETGCDIIINGGLFDGYFKPCCWLKVNGSVLHTEAWHTGGFGWDVANLTYDTSDHIAKYRNYIQCVDLPMDDLSRKPDYPKAMGGVRGRSAIGLRADGSMVLWCTQDGAYALTPESLQIEMHNLGCVSATMLDGGGSCQCIMPNGSIASSRIVYDFLLIWIAKETTTPPQNTQTQTTTSPAKPACSDGTKDACQYRLPCHYCLKQYKMCPLITS